MNLPSEEECLRLYSEYNTPPNVIAHCRAVKRLAVLLADYLQKAGVEIDRDLVGRASLLHDLVRTPDQFPNPAFKNLHHAEINFQILKGKYPEMAEVIQSHQLHNLLDLKSLDTWEKRVVNYADKRVNEDQIVSIQDRLKLGRQRWHIRPEDDRGEEILKKLEELEKELFSHLSIKPQDLNGLSG